MVADDHRHGQSVHQGSSSYFSIGMWAKGRGRLQFGASCWGTEQEACTWKQRRPAHGDQIGTSIAELEACWVVM
jgi:hypothetical protein